MEDLATQRREIDDKLEREMERLGMLKDCMNRSNQMTDNMISILTSFENRLLKLEHTITPVYMETGNLQRRHENIEKSLVSLDHVIGFYHVAEEVEPVVREGPSTGLENYISCMDKLKKAVNFFNKSNPGSPELAQVTTLYEAGKDSLEKEFRNLLTRHSKPVPAVIVLDTLAADDEDLPHVDVQTIEHLPERVKAELVQIADWLLNSGYHTDYMQVYRAVRSNILLKSLQGLRDHLKTGSKDSANNLGVGQSPALGAKFKGKGAGSRKALTPGKRMEFVRKASANLMKYSIGQQLEAAGLRRQGSSASDLKEEGVMVDIDFYITGVSALLKLIQSEFLLMQNIVPKKVQRQVFEGILQAALDSIVKEGEQIVANIRHAITRHDHNAVLGIFPVLKHLRAIRPEFDKALEGCQPATLNKLPSLIAMLDKTGARALNEFVDHIRNDPDKSSNMPKDGTVHELTSNTIIFLEQLLEFCDTAGAMLLSSESQPQSARPNSELAHRKVAEFITKVLSSLGLNLSNKVETYSDVTLRAIFMLNNYNYILKSLKRTGLIEIVQLESPEIDLHYEDMSLEQKRLYSQRAKIMALVHKVNPEVEQLYCQQIVQQKKGYMASWSRVLHYIMDTKAPIAASDKLKDKERQAIKDKFTGFNKEIDEIHRVQRGYSIPDADLRDTLRKDNREFVLPRYKAFLEKFRAINFTKNPDKYIKYSVTDVASMMDKLFNSAM